MSPAGGRGSGYPRYPKWEQEAHREGQKCPAGGLDMHISSALKRDCSQLWLRCAALSTAPYRILIDWDFCIQAKNEAKESQSYRDPPCTARKWKKIT